MATLREAIDAIKPSFASTKRFEFPLLEIRPEGVVRSFNGNLAGTALFNLGSFLEETVVVRADFFSKVWKDKSTVSLDGNMLTVKAGKSKYTFPTVEPKLFGSPEFIAGGVLITDKALAAIKVAALLASENATYPWACGVMLKGGKAYSTNNIAVMSVDCPLKFEGLLPFWFISVLEAGSFIGTNGNSFTMTRPDKLSTIWSGALEGTMPEGLFTVADALKLCKTSVEIFDKEAFNFESRYCTINADTGELITSPMDQYEATYAFPKSKGVVRLQAVLASQVLSIATHVSFERAPNALLFSSNVEPKFVGICSGMTR